MVKEVIEEKSETKGSGGIVTIYSLESCQDISEGKSYRPFALSTTRKLFDKPLQKHVLRFSHINTSNTCNLIQVVHFITARECRWENSRNTFLEFYSSVMV